MKKSRKIVGKTLEGFLGNKKARSKYLDRKLVSSKLKSKPGKWQFYIGGTYLDIQPDHEVDYNFHVNVLKDISVDVLFTLSGLAQENKVFKTMYKDNGRIRTGILVCEENEIDTIIRMRGLKEKVVDRVYITIIKIG